MMVFAWILMLAASAHHELANEMCQVPAGEWRYVEVDLNRDAARVTADFEAQPGSVPVRLMLMNREDLERMQDDLPHGHLLATPLELSGRLSDRFHRRGEYVVLVDNREGSHAAQVHLHVWLEFGNGRGPEVTYLSPQRQLTVVALSLAVFFGIVSYSGRRLWRVVKR